MSEVNTILFISSFLTTESKQLPASKVKNFILRALFLFKSAIKANKVKTNLNGDCEQ